MITAPLFRFLTNPGKKTPGHFLYSIEDSGIMLYIGRSLQPVKRLRHHVSINGLNEIGTLGKLIFCNLPNSLYWQVLLYTLADCEQTIARYYQSDVFSGTLTQRSEWLQEYHHVAGRDAREQYNNFSASFGTAYVSEAEAALIWYLKPCCNVVFNDAKPPYPSTVKDPKAYFTLFPDPRNARTYFRHHLERTAYDAA